MIIEELTEGLPGFTNDSVEDDNKDTSEFKAINPPTTRENQKTTKKRKIQRRLRNEERQRMNAKIEKKKISDLYRYIIVRFHKKLPIYQSVDLNCSIFCDIFFLFLPIHNFLDYVISKKNWMNWKIVLIKRNLKDYKKDGYIILALSA